MDLLAQNRQLSVTSMSNPNILIRYIDNNKAVRISEYLLLSNSA